MARRYLHADREQGLLLQPSLRDWLPDDHVVWALLEAVDELDLAGFGDEDTPQRGRPGFHPRLMVALLLWSYCTGVLSSREVERSTVEHLVFRVITANRRIDHVTVNRFRKRYAAELAGLHGQVLALCAAAGLGQIGMVALDGTKLAANAGIGKNRTRAELELEAARLLAEAERVDAAEDARYGDANGQQTLPPELADRAARRRRLKTAKEGIERAERELAARDAEAAAAHEQRLQERAQQEACQGQRLAGRKPQPPRPDPHERVNLTDPESRIMQRADKGWVQGYNAQIVATQDQLILAAHVTNAVTDQHQLGPLSSLALRHVSDLAADAEIGCLLADAGYWSHHNADHPVLREAGIEILISPHRRRSQRTYPAGSPEHTMQQRLAEPDTKTRYKRRCVIAEPPFAALKHLRRIVRFSRRGLEACQHEFALMAITHNLNKLAHHQRRLATA